MSGSDLSSPGSRKGVALAAFTAVALGLVVPWLLGYFDDFGDPGGLGRRSPGGPAAASPSVPGLPSGPMPRTAPSQAPEADAAPSIERATEGDTSASPAPAVAAVPGANATAAGAGAARDAMPSPQALARMTNFDKRQHFDRSAARAAGLSEGEIDRLYDHWQTAGRAIHARIAADEAAGRRVRPGTRRYDEALREFLDDDEFDAVLYATHQQNRVQLRAPAEGGRPMADGLQPGDVIERYDGVPVYRLVDLQLMMKDTSADARIPVVVRRDGELVEVEVPGRDPLGPKSPLRTPPLGR